MSDSQRFLAVLLAAYLVLAVWLAIAPYDRLTWLIENATIWILVAIIVSLWRGGIVFSRTAYALMFILIYLHTIGGHYTFALVPFGWVTETFGFARNHFDRLAHVSVGFYAYAIAELLWTRRLVNHRWLLFSYPVFAIATVAMAYEGIEWIYADLSDPEAGAAYLGSQGDIWDAQKDMLADTLGGIAATLLFFARHGLWKARPAGI